MPLSTYAGNAVLNALLNNTALQKVPYASLHSGDPGLTGASELSGSSYARVAATFSAPDGDGDTSNSGVITFATASGNWSASTYFGLWDQLAAGGNFLGGAALTTARTVLSGQYAEFAAAALLETLATQFGNTTLDNICNALFRNTALQVAQAYASLHTADPGGTGASELPDAESYARIALTFAAADAKACANDAVTDFVAAGGDGWAAVTHLGLWDSGVYGAGTFLWGKVLTAPATVAVGQVARMAVGGVNVTIT